MALRLIEAIIPKDSAAEFVPSLQDYPLLGLWEENLSNERVLLRILVEAEHTERIFDRLAGRFSSTQGFRTMLFSVEATLPRPEPPPEPTPSEKKKKAEQQEQATRQRISREELYHDVTESARLNMVYIVTVVLSTLVASIGLLRNDVAVIIGAMVIAPLLGPNVSLALATTLGDLPLISRSLRVNAVGLVIALAIAVLIGWMLPVDETIPAISSRTRVGLGDIVLALSAGSAGALAFTTGVPTAVIGVMVAVALLPPLAVFGLLLSGGTAAAAFQALLLVLTNVICVNLAGVATFLAQGIRPRNWWEADRAKHSTRVAITLWILLLGGLLLTILLAR